MIDCEVEDLDVVGPFLQAIRIVVIEQLQIRLIMVPTEVISCTLLLNGLLMKATPPTGASW
jgi:hypothetical protein